LSLGSAIYPDLDALDEGNVTRLCVNLNTPATVALCEEPFMIITGYFAAESSPFALGDSPTTSGRANFVELFTSRTRASACPV
jgi:hypothetical protein